MPHFSITQSSVVTLITQLVSFVVGFGVINSTEAGVVIAAATAVVNLGFLLANSLHAFAHAAVSSAPTAPRTVYPTPPAG